MFILGKRLIDARVNREKHNNDNCVFEDWIFHNVNIFFPLSFEQFRDQYVFFMLPFYIILILQLHQGQEIKRFLQLDLVCFFSRCHFFCQKNKKNPRKSQLIVLTAIILSLENLEKSTLFQKVKNYSRILFLRIGAFCFDHTEIIIVFQNVFVG